MSAPASAIRPPTSQAPRISEGEGSAPAISDGVRKIPDPIVPPIAIIVMSKSVRLRRSSAMEGQDSRGYLPKSCVASTWVSDIATPTPR